MNLQGPKPSSTYLERQPLTRSPTTPTAPTNRSSAYAPGQNDPGPGNPLPGDGLVLANVFAIVVSIYPWAGQTITSGSLLCWIYNPYQAVWTRCDDLDYDLASASGFQAKTFPALENVSRLGTLINWAFSSVVFSAGSTDGLLRLDGFTSVGGQAI